MEICPDDIASFMGNMDIAQLTRSLKTEENVNKSDFRLQCRDYAAKLEEAILRDQASDMPNMCKSPLWIGSWLSCDYMSCDNVAQKAADLRMATALSNAGLCALVRAPPCTKITWNHVAKSIFDPSCNHLTRCLPAVRISVSRHFLWKIFQNM